jgi:hypothetical protein
MRLNEIVTRDDAELQHLDLDHDDNFDDSMAKEAKASFIFKPLCSPEVRRIVKGINNTTKLCKVLETSRDTNGSYIGRQDILCKFCTCWAMEHQPLNTYFTMLSNHGIPEEYTDDAFRAHSFYMQIFTALPS